MIEVEISAEQVEPPSWLPDFSSLARLAVDAVGRSRADVRVLFCDRDRIAELNQTFRKISEPTDVLSFPDTASEAGAEDLLAGDIAICSEEVHDNANEFNVAPQEEMSRVFVHALLHLAGYEHGTVTTADPEADDQEMFQLQERIVDQYTKERDRE